MNTLLCERDPPSHVDLDVDPLQSNIQSYPTMYPQLIRRLHLHFMSDIHPNEHFIVQVTQENEHATIDTVYNHIILSLLSPSSVDKLPLGTYEPSEFRRVLSLSEDEIAKIDDEHIVQLYIDTLSSWFDISVVDMAKLDHNKLWDHYVKHPYRLFGIPPPEETVQRIQHDIWTIDGRQYEDCLFCIPISTEHWERILQSEWFIHQGMTLPSISTKFKEYGWRCDSMYRFMFPCIVPLEKENKERKNKVEQTTQTVLSSMKEEEKKQSSSSTRRKRHRGRRNKKRPRHLFYSKMDGN